MNKKIYRVLAVLLLLFALPTVQAMQSVNATYRVSYNGINATASARVAPSKNGTWVYAMTIDHLVASLDQATVFQDLAGVYRPLGASTQSSFASIKRNSVARYDWGKGAARWTGDVKPGRAGPVRLQSGDMDAMLLNLALVRDVSAGRPLHYRMVDNGRARAAVYRAMGMEKVTIAGRSYQATKVGEVRGNRQVFAWIVKGIPLPVRMLQREGGKDKVNLTMTAWSH